MRRTSPPGNDNAKRESGYVLVEAIALTAVLLIGMTAVVVEVADGLRSLERQRSFSTQMIEEENGEAIRHIEDTAGGKPLEP
jgi:hypothetical protein